MSILKEERETKFTEVYRQYIDEIYQYVLLRTGLNESISEDLTQEIFTSVYRGMSDFKGLCSQRTWIYRITKNKLNDYYRKQYSNRPQEVEFDKMLIETLEDATQDVSNKVIRKFEQAKVRECLNRLPEEYRVVLVLKYMDEIPVKTIAQHFGKSLKATESILQRAKKSFANGYARIEEEAK